MRQHIYSSPSSPLHGGATHKAMLCIALGGATCALLASRFRGRGPSVTVVGVLCKHRLARAWLSFSIMHYAFCIHGFAVDYSSTASGPPSLTREGELRVLVQIPNTIPIFYLGSFRA